MCNRKTIAKIVATFMKIWPDKISADNETYNVWHQVLMDKPDSLVLRAAQDYVSKNQWCPMPANIRRKCAELELGDVLGPDEAWGSVQRFIATHGQDSGIKPREVLSALAVSAVKDAGGFYELRHGELIAAFRKRFHDAYNKRLETSIEQLMDLPEIRQLKKQNSIAALPSPADTVARLDESHSIGNEVVDHFFDKLERKVLR